MVPLFDDKYHFTDKVYELLCSALGVSSKYELSVYHISRPFQATPKNDYIVKKIQYPNYHINSSLGDSINIVKRVNGDIEYLVVLISTRNLFQSYETGMVVTKNNGDMRKLIYRHRKYPRQTQLKTVILEEKTMKIIENRVIKYYKLFSKNPDIMNSGLIFHGPPGNGKTSIINHIRQSCNIVYVSSDDIIRNKLSPNKTAYVYILDDVSIKLFNEEQSPATASYLRTLMDGDRKATGVWILCTNEDVKTMHSAFLRPGRFDKVLEFPKPCPVLRKKFIDTWDIPDIDKDALIEKSSGWSFAELAYVKNYLCTQKLLGEPCKLEDALESREFSKAEKKKAVGFMSE